MIEAIAPARNRPAFTADPIVVEWSLGLIAFLALLFTPSVSPVLFGAAAALYASYCVYLGIAYAHGVDGGCGCSQSSNRLGADHIARAAVLAMLSMLASTNGVDGLTTIAQVSLSLMGLVCAFILWVLPDSYDRHAVELGG